MAVKRTTSDPGQRLHLTYQQPVQSATTNQQPNTQQPQAQPAVTESFTMTGYAEDGGYFSPSLQDEVFQQVTTVPDSVLLHATHLDSIQVNNFIYNLRSESQCKYSFKQHCTFVLLIQ